MGGTSDLSRPRVSKLWSVVTNTTLPESCFSRPNSAHYFSRASRDRVLRSTSLLLLATQLDYISQAPLWLGTAAWQSSSQGMRVEMLLARASLVAWWLRIRLPTQGTRVRALVWEAPTCRGATKPTNHNYRAHMPQLLKATRLEPVLCHKRSHRNEKPAHRNEE